MALWRALSTGERLTLAIALLAFAVQLLAGLRANVLLSAIGGACSGFAAGMLVLSLRGPKGTGL